MPVGHYFCACDAIDCSKTEEPVADVAPRTKHYLLASDFDQTLSFNDSGQVLSDLIGVGGYREKVDGLAASNLVQQGGELAYLIRHDPEFRGVRREHLIEAGRRVGLKRDIPALVAFLARGLDGYRFSFYVISAGPRELVQAALDGLVPPENVFGTEFAYEPASGEVRAIHRVAAGYGKVAVLEELQARHGVEPDHAIYVGDGSSDVHVMLHVNNRGGFTIAASENPYLASIARRTVLSDSAVSFLVPVLDEIVGWRGADIQALLEQYQLARHGWEKARTDRILPVALASGLVAGTVLQPAAGGR
jgi:phosphoserine phosphatase